MYKHLEKILYDKSITTKALASLLDVSEKTAINKIRGISDFSLGEAMKICAVVCPEYKLDYVFATAENEIVNDTGVA